MYAPPSETTPPIWEFPVEDQLLLVRAGSERLFLLNSTAQRIWRACSVSQSPADGVRALSEEFDAPLEALKADVEATLAGWRAGGLLGSLSPAPQQAPAPPEVPDEDLDWQHYAIGEFSFTVGLPPGLLQEDLALRIATYRQPAAPAGATRYRAIPSAYGWAVYRDGELLDTGDSVFATRVIVLHDVLRAAHGDTSWCANLHAGIVANGDRGVILSGASGAGKSTLTVAAQLAGLDVLGDDSAPVLAQSGHLAATPLATMLREGSWGLFPDLARHYHVSEIHERPTGRVRFVTARALGPLRQCAASALLFVNRAPGMPPALAPLGMVDTLARLNEAGFWVAPQQDLIAYWLEWLQRLPRYEMRYDTPAEGVALLRELLQP